MQQKQRQLQVNFYVTNCVTNHVLGIPWVSQKPKLGCCEAPPKCVVRSGRCKSHFLYGYTVCVCWCDMSTQPFVIYVILYLYYRFLCSISSLRCCKRKCFGIPLRVLKLISLLLVKLKCPMRDDSSFLTWLEVYVCTGQHASKAHRNSLALGVQHHGQQVQQREPVLRQLGHAQLHQLLRVLQDAFLHRKRTKRLWGQCIPCTKDGKKPVIRENGQIMGSATIIIICSFYVALIPALEQTHCAHRHDITALVAWA